MSKVNRIAELVKELNKYRDSYYNDSISLVSDAEYDRLFDELLFLEQETGLALSNSPTRQVGYEVKSKLKKRNHPTMLKSLDKTKSLDTLNEWRNNQDVIVMLKKDGLTVELNYDNGEFIGGYTRGDGEVGEDITHNCKVFKNMPINIPFKGKLRIVGEAVIHWNDFNEINNNLPDEEKYKTPRNLVSGSVRQLDSKICANRSVYWYSFGIIECDEKLTDSKQLNFEWLKEQGFWTVFSLKANNDITQKDLMCMTNYAKDINVPIDGLVISYDSIFYSNRCSETSHHPTHSLAYKFTDEKHETILNDVEWNTTRTGRINPTAILKTVLIDGTNVSRASLFNLTFIKNKKLNTGCRVNVVKRNMIIPYIEENLDQNKGMLLRPLHCPACGGETTIKVVVKKNINNQDEEIEFLYCNNKQCPAQLLDKFVHFVSKAGMNIDGLSEATLEKFINKGVLKSFDDVYYLGQHKNHIISMEGFGLKSYNKLIENIDKSRKVKCANLIYALGIPQIGKGGAKIIAEYFENNFSSFIKSIEDGFDFSQLKDFGKITNDEIHKWYKDVPCRELWIGVLEEVEVIQEVKKEVSNTDNPFNGKKIYCTGTFANYKKNQLKELLEGLGAAFGSGYSKNLDYLIVGSIKGSSKTDKAQKDGISVLTEDQFIEMIK